MNKMLKPSEVSKRLNISTSLLRDYESKGLIPKPHRDANGYRMYDHHHIVYIEAVRAMSLGFNISVVSSILRDVQNNVIEKALWTINEVQVQNKEDCQLLITLRARLENRCSSDEKMIQVGEVAKSLGISTTALRYWEREGLILSTRNSENNYRYYQREEFVKAGILKILQCINYSKETVEIKNKIKCTGNDPSELKQLANQCQKLMDIRNYNQIHGLHYLYKVFSYCKGKQFSNIPR